MQSGAERPGSEEEQPRGTTVSSGGFIADTWRGVPVTLGSAGEKELPKSTEDEMVKVPPAGVTAPHITQTRSDIEIVGCLR